jgi:glycosyltransferase involved in cell wall biosynthesis
MFGMAAVEAQACGRPVVSRDAGGLKEVLLSNRGARILVGDPARMADEIEKLWTMRISIRSVPRMRCSNVATYDWSRICDRCDELYRAAS